MKMDMTIDLDSFINKNDWEVIHEPETNLYELKNKNGRKFPGKFTTRVFALNALADYLDNIEKESQKAKEKKAKEEEQKIKEAEERARRNAYDRAYKEAERQAKQDLNVNS